MSTFHTPPKTIPLQYSLPLIRQLCSTHVISVTRSNRKRPRGYWSVIPKDFGTHRSILPAYLIVSVNIYLSLTSSVISDAIIKLRVILTCNFDHGFIKWLFDSFFFLWGRVLWSLKCISFWLHGLYCEWKYFNQKIHFW